MKNYLRLLKYLKPYAKYCWGALTCMLLMSLCSVLIIPLVAKLSEAVAAKNFVFLNLIIGSAVIIYFLRGGFVYGQIYLMSHAARRVVCDLRIQMFKKLQDLSLDYYANARTGDTISRVLNDVNLIQTALISSVTELLPSLLTLGAVFGYLSFLNWRLTFLTFFILPLIAFTITKLGLQMRDATSLAQAKLADLAALLQETLTGVRVVKSFAMEKFETEKFSKEAEKSFELSMKQSQVSATQIPLLGFLQALGVIAVIWFGGYEVVSGRLDPNNLIAFFTGIALLADPLAKIGSINSIVQESLAAAERVFDLIDLSPTVQEKPNPIKLGPIQGFIEFNQVSFVYENNQEHVLKDISLKVSPGEIIALVGPSGAGKSTLVNLIPRFYDPQHGSVSLDGHNLKDLDLHSLRSQIGVVPQETMLFSGTILDNISYGKVGATKEEIMAAAQAAHAHQFIMDLPDQYLTLVGERGAKLSGGQQQRIAIARALLKNPKILIFDEATSSLDSESEKLVQDAMDRLMQGRTTFVIAHRLSTVQHATRILVLNRGQIVEAGSHSFLIEKDGLYKKLHSLQFRDEKNTLHN